MQGLKANNGKIIYGDISFDFEGNQYIHNLKERILKLRIDMFEFLMMIMFVMLTSIAYVLLEGQGQILIEEM